jgi:Fur family transcriptional regulator, ferric uptake regulator
MRNGSIRSAGSASHVSSAAGRVLRSTLRGAGLRVTLPRLAVLRVLRQADTPLSHGDVFTAVADQLLDRATVYRNLLDLVRAGLARRTDLGDHVWRFEAMRVAGARRRLGAGEHPHFVCNACGTVECLGDLTLRPSRSSRVPRAVRTRAVEILVKGLCDRCE